MFLSALADHCWGAWASTSGPGGRTWWRCADRAARLERERDQQAQLAAAAERARIAREMHDIVAHNLSVMIALADGAAFAAAAFPRAGRQRDRSQVSATGREALAEMRRLLGVLRESATAPRRCAPQPEPGRRATTWSTRCAGPACRSR